MMGLLNEIVMYEAFPEVQLTHDYANRDGIQLSFSKRLGNSVRVFLCYDHFFKLILRNSGVGQ